jgi:hypothetical protein
MKSSIMLKAFSPKNSQKVILNGSFCLMYYYGEREQEKNSMGIWPILVEIVKKKKEHKKQTENIIMSRQSRTVLVRR